MTRTQIMLEESQHLALRQLASSQGKSLGGIVREFIDEGLRRRKRRGRADVGDLASLRGFIPRARATGRDHDEAIFGER
jgi:hypothetical protein